MRSMYEYGNKGQSCIGVIGSSQANFTEPVKPVAIQALRPGRASVSVKEDSRCPKTPTHAPMGVYLR